MVCSHSLYCLEYSLITLVCDLYYSIHRSLFYAWVLCLWGVSRFVGVGSEWCKMTSWSLRRSGCKLLWTAHNCFLCSLNSNLRWNMTALTNSLSKVLFIFLSLHCFNLSVIHLNLWYPSCTSHQINELLDLKDASKHWNKETLV